MRDPGRRELDHAYDALQGEVPGRVARAMRWVRAPERRMARIPLGLLFVAGGLLSFLPVLGIWLLPLGLLLIAQDVPPLRPPVARGTLWLVGRWRALRESWRRRRRRPSRAER